jgi:TonB family protein
LKRVCRLLLIALLCVLHSAAQTSAPPSTAAAEPEDASWQRYLHILRTSTLEWSQSEPFLLEVSYQLYDLDGRPAIKGTAEESWTEANGRQIRIQSPSLVIGDTAPADPHALFTRESYLVHQALSALARPFPAVIARKDFSMNEFRQTIAGAEQDCFSLVQPGTTAAPNVPAYCTDEENHIIVITGALFTIGTSDFRKYRGHEIPNHLILSYEGKPALSLDVTELDPLPHMAVANSRLEASPSARRVGAETLSGLALKQIQPTYPKEAKKKHIAGTVLIRAIISKQGTISDMTVIASPDQLLTQAATEAVRSWTYRPYLLNGIPVEVETTINMKFAFGK